MPDPRTIPLRLGRWLPPVVVLAMPIAVLLLPTHGRRATSSDDRVALGREVYVAEGCIHCHSQYVRPGTGDSELWGRPRDPEFSRQQSPALIGNRRQGPDLMNVGLRRLRDWQRMHLIDPRLVSPASRMPSYAHLFEPGEARGEALLDYLDSLGREPAAGPESAAAQAPGAVSSLK